MPFTREFPMLVGVLMLAYAPIGSAAAGYIADTNGCKAFNESPVIGESIIWTGTCKDGFIDGPGTLSWTAQGAPDGSTTGSFSKGKIEGPGARLSKNGSRYEGNFQGNKPNGEGKLTYPNGAVYVGNFVAGRRDGHGVVTYPSGHRYEGDFKGGFVGQGTLTYPNGVHVTGRFDGSPFDDDVVTEADGSVFTGILLGRSATQGEERGWQLAFNQQLSAALSSDSHTVQRGLVTGLLRVTFAADGSPASYKLEASSASTELDDRVLAVVRDIKSLPPFPKPDKSVVVIFYDAVHTTTAAAATGADAPAPGEFGLKMNGSTGTMLARNQIQGLRVPPNKSYEDLSPEEKQIVRSKYQSIPAADEPPYPMGGPEKLYRGASDLARRYAPEGELSLVVDINEKGIATGVSVLANPGQDFVKDVATLLMVQKYKPAICAGQPCKMQYPFAINYLGITH